METVQPVKFAPLMIQGLECLKENTQCLGREVFVGGVRWDSFLEFVQSGSLLLFFLGGGFKSGSHGVFLFERQNFVPVGSTA